MRQKWICAGALALMTASPVAGADTDPKPEPFPDFTFKMAKPPKPGAGKRITVQIEPQAAQPNAADPQAKPKDGRETAAPPRSAAYGWYWAHVPDGIGENGTERLRKAMTGLSVDPGIPGPRLQDIQTIATAQGARILRETIGTRVSPALVLAVIAVESGGRRAAESHKGAQGLMQLMPDTAKRFGVSDSLSEAQNIRGGVAYLDWLLREFDGDAVLALAGYNAGENAVKTHEGVPPYAETRDYIPKVLAAYQVARGLCKTQPDLITDACALNLAMK